MIKNIRKARISDAKQIQSLINFYAAKDLMISRSLNEIYENMRDFWVCEENRKIIGCCGLHIVGWENLAEIKSLAVEKTKHNKGIGRKLVEICLQEAKELKLKKVFALTYSPGFFRKSGFKKISKSKLPHKIWAECCNCPKFPGCEEEAMIKNI
ncbi:MAG: N-acetyltransferase [Candidatus Omnitrophica bacterium]|nr:N-acetyltransferase [Candidatus Omnitrophota bacterium]MDD5352343.1 N-acetyltransferase [Candidatus Omnitrophota bacterium]MDD5549941.1 N-acetyltransferase [Candidatus Omnitrophota bacterium]